MSRLGTTLRRAVLLRRRPSRDDAAERPFHVVAVANNKGGVGKTTLATNLAVFVRALRPELRVLLLGLDDQSLIDRIFAGDEQPRRTWRNVESGLRVGSFAGALQTGRYGVDYVPSAPDLSELQRELADPLRLRRTLEQSDVHGVVLVDTKSDLGILTRNALAAADLVLVPVRDDTSLREGLKVFDLMQQWGWPRERVRIVLSMIDLRIKYHEGDARDILALMLQEIRRRELPLFESFVSHSPLVEALCTQPDGRPLTVLQGAPGSRVHGQLQRLAGDVLELLGRAPALAGPIDAAPPPGVAQGSG